MSLKAYNDVPDFRLPRPNNMGLLRYYLSLSVFINHFNTLTGNTFSWPTSAADRLGAFFVMSGFLIYGSYARHGNTRSFLERRVKRIVPAYSLVILLAAFGFAAISTLPAAEYFTSPQWWKYVICNLLYLNFLEPELPGVFQGMDISAVNGAMWTMKVEWMMYLSVPLFAWIYDRWGRRFGPLRFFGAIYVLSVAYSTVLLYQHAATGRALYEMLQRQCFGQMAFFYGGALLYFYFPRLMAHKKVMFTTAVGLYLLTIWPTLIDGPARFAVGVVRPMAMSLIVIMLTFTGRWGCWADSMRTNVSYDIYLYHYPVIQLFVSLGVIEAVGPYAGFAICAVVTVGMACFSWFVVGRPILEGTGWYGALRRRCRIFRATQ